MLQNLIYIVIKIHSPPTLESQARSWTFLRCWTIRQVAVNVMGIIVHLSKTRLRRYIKLRQYRHCENLEWSWILDSSRGWRLKERLPVRGDDWLTFLRGRNYLVVLRTISGWSDSLASESCKVRPALMNRFNNKRRIREGRLHLNYQSHDRMQIIIINLDTLALKSQNAKPKCKIVENVIGNC